jgi:hypothetical protein
VTPEFTLGAMEPRETGAGGGWFWDTVNAEAVRLVLYFREDANTGEPMYVNDAWFDEYSPVILLRAD